MQLTKIDINKMRYLVAFERFTGIKTIECFHFNDAIVFVINPVLLKIILARKERLRKLSKFLGRKVKVLAIPLKKDKEAIEKFLNALIAPSRIKNVNLTDSKLIVYPGYSKAVLLGKDKRNVQLLKEIFHKYFRIEEIEIK